jgi:hypothetical protein
MKIGEDHRGGRYHKLLATAFRGTTIQDTLRQGIVINLVTPL